MASPLPPDPYLALGVAKDSGAGAIKTQYRKLVLKFHPDKVKDEAQKKAAADEFHKIQTAYEIIGDEDRRQRYDAQVKLSELRKEVMTKGGSEVKTAAYKFPTEPKGASAYHARGPDRVSPTYEERKPSYAAQDYFDQTTTTSRKDREDPYERAARYEPVRDDYEKSKAPQKSSKDTERSSRKEKSKRVDKDIRRERDRKPAPARVEIVSEPSSSEDEYERAARRRGPGGRERWEEEQKRMKEQFWAQAQRQKEEADRGVYSDERARKMFSQHAQAFDAIRGGAKRQEQVRRSSPPRQSSSKENWKTAFAKVRARPEMSRRESTRSRPSTRDMDSQVRRPSTREYDRRTSDDLTDEPRESRKPGLTTVRTSPLDIRTTEKPRAQSVQMDKDDLLPQPQMRRAETMPMQSLADRERERDRDARKSKDPHVPSTSSGLRQTEFQEGIPTPSASPEYSATAQDPGTYYRYHSQYADDDEYATPDGYKTTQAKTRKVTRSPSQMHEREREVRETRPESRDFREPRDPVREKARAASARYAQQAVPPPPLPARTTSTSYVYNDGRSVDSYTRPVMSRGDSSRGEHLYGEMPREKGLPQTRSPKISSKYSPPLEAEHRPSTAPYRTRQAEEAESRPAYTYSRRPGEAKPSYPRTNSRTQQPIFAVY